MGEESEGGGVGKKEWKRDVKRAKGKMWTRKVS